MTTTNNPTNTNDLALLWHEETSQSGTYKIIGHVVQIDHTNSMGYQRHPDPAYEDLRVQGCGYERHDGSRRLSSWEVEYQPYSVKLFQAEAMVKMLRQIERKLTSYDEAYGRVESYGVYVQRVCQALKIPRMATYSRDQGLQMHALAVGASRINRLIDTWISRAA